MTDTKTVRITLDFQVPADAHDHASSWLIEQYGNDFLPERSVEEAVEQVVVDVITDELMDKPHILDGWALVSSHTQVVE